MSQFFEFVHSCFGTLSGALEMREGRLRRCRWSGIPEMLRKLYRHEKADCIKKESSSSHRYLNYSYRIIIAFFPARLLYSERFELLKTPESLQILYKFSNEQLFQHR
ncbi:hypothetical protein KP509_12G030300 [Ceratopteris richardii]|uniref:Uncharacterized protein n=1 Tax=Ceratopteris richardii TaxID=49495 RepID=A0A8T2TMF6_CERRI|nr:hypothetical protein KP509_12G030300 [Ceratopteris richardii]